MAMMPIIPEAIVRADEIPNPKAIAHGLLIVKGKSHLGSRAEDPHFSAEILSRLFGRLLVIVGEDSDRWRLEGGIQTLLRQKQRDGRGRSVRQQTYD